MKLQLHEEITWCIGFDPEPSDRGMKLLSVETGNCQRLALGTFKHGQWYEGECEDPLIDFRQIVLAWATVELPAQANSEEVVERIRRAEEIISIDESGY